MTRHGKEIHVTGHLHRIVDGAMLGSSIEEAMIMLLSKEVVIAGWPNSTVRRAL